MQDLGVAALMRRVTRRSQKAPDVLGSEIVTACSETSVFWITTQARSCWQADRAITPPSFAESHETQFAHQLRSERATFGSSVDRAASEVCFGRS